VIKIVKGRKYIMYMILKFWNGFVIRHTSMIIATSVIVFGLLVLTLFYYRDRLSGTASTQQTVVTPTNLEFYIFMGITLSIPILSGLIVAFSKYKNSIATRLRIRGNIFELLAYIITISSVAVLLLLFYIFNRSSAPTLLQIAGNSFLGMFILLNLISWFDKTPRSARS
jgi:ABC-type proline/glycine betaine transport system permease subunit